METLKKLSMCSLRVLNLWRGGEKTWKKNGKKKAKRKEQRKSGRKKNGKHAYS